MIEEGKTGSLNSRSGVVSYLGIYRLSQTQVRVNLCLLLKRSSSDFSAKGSTLFTTWVCEMKLEGVYACLHS